MNTPPTRELAEAIEELTKFLRNGSQTPDPQRFSAEQWKIQHDFRVLLIGLGRSVDRPGRLVNPVLSNGHLTLGAPLPTAAYRIGGYTGTRDEVWLIDVAAGTTPPGTQTHLQNSDIVTKDVVRLRVFDNSGRRILIGIPKIVDNKPAPQKIP